MKEEKIKEFIEKIYALVEDKPGYVWFNKRKFEIIKIETLVESLKNNLILTEKLLQQKTKQEEQK